MYFSYVADAEYVFLICGRCQTRVSYVADAEDVFLTCGRCQTCVWFGVLLQAAKQTCRKKGGNLAEPSKQGTLDLIDEMMVKGTARASPRYVKFPYHMFVYMR